MVNKCEEGKPAASGFIIGGFHYLFVNDGEKIQQIVSRFDLILICHDILLGMSLPVCHQPESVTFLMITSIVLGHFYLNLA